MLTRRDFLQAAGLAALVPGACVTRPAATTEGEWVNDIHSQLNRTWVSAVAQPRSTRELQALLAQSGRTPVAIAGGRHAMGGQQFAADATLIDIRSMNRVLSFDEQRGIIEVESGIQWPELIREVVARGRGRWAIAQKQTGADRLTLGGSLAANVHGRGLTMKPIVGDVESFTLIDASGKPVECSRTSNRELFSLAIGGYGLFGVISTIRLRLVPRRKVQRVVEVLDIEGLMSAFEKRIADAFLYGDFQFSINEKSENFLRRGVFSCYRPVSDDTPIPATQAELKPEDWMKLLFVAHADKEQAYEHYVGYYLGTSGQVYWSDEHQLSFYPDYYHQALDKALRAKEPASEIITEIYVPRPRLADFMVEAREDFRRNNVNVIYGTVRLIERDDETFLPWAKQSYACVIFNLHTTHTAERVQHSVEAFRRLIDMAIRRDGSYFLTYHRYAGRDQVDACYPQFADFLRRKRHYDPERRFQSEWYRQYAKIYGA